MGVGRQPFGVGMKSCGILGGGRLLSGGMMWSLMLLLGVLVA